MNYIDTKETEIKETEIKEETEFIKFVKQYIKDTYFTKLLIVNELMKLISSTNRVNTFYKLSLVQPFSKIIDQIYNRFNVEVKKIKSNININNFYTNKRDDYMGVLLKIVPFLKTINQEQ